MAESKQQGRLDQPQTAGEEASLGGQSPLKRGGSSDPVPPDSVHDGAEQISGGQGRQAEPPQEALFVIEGPDEDGCVWLCSAEGRDTWCANLGPNEKAIELFSAWLAQTNQQD